MTRRFEGLTAIVTGGASGIGLAAAQRFAAEGARVLITDWSAKRGEAAASSLASIGYDAGFQHHDAGDLASWQAVKARVERDYGKLHILVNNAYSGAAATVETLTPEGLRDAMRVNVEGAALGLRLASETMPDGGSVVNMSSAAAFVANPDNIAYATAKLALVQITRSAAAGLARRSPPIRVNAVAPGFTQTRTLEAAVRAVGGASADADLDAALRGLVAGVPLGRVALAEEIAAAIAFLASPDASYITGQCLIVDGGATLTSGLDAASGR